MNAPLSALPPINEIVREHPGWLERVLSPEESVEFLGNIIAVPTLTGMRTKGGGPDFVRLTTGKRGRVGYTRRALLEWLAKRTRTSTSDPGPELAPAPAPRVASPPHAPVPAAPRRSHARSREGEAEHTLAE